MDHLFEHFFSWFGMPSVGLPAVFISAFISATLIPIGSEPILFGYISLNPNLYWVAIFIAAVGNTCGGMLDWWLGLLAANKITAIKVTTEGGLKQRLKDWGPKMLLLSWFPGLGDPLCFAAGWLKLPWKQCLLYMFFGKLFRYLIFTWLLTLVPDSIWHQLGHWLHLI